MYVPRRTQATPKNSNAGYCDLSPRKNAVTAVNANVKLLHIGEAVVTGSFARR